LCFISALRDNPNPIHEFRRMSAKEADIPTIIGRIIVRSHDIEKLLRTHYNVTSRGLHKTIDDLAERLPAVLARTIRVVAIVRNAAAHPEKFKIKTIPPDFDRLCDEIELLIPYFVDQQRAPAARTIKEAMPPIAKTQNSGVSATKPPSQSKLWTDEEVKQLIAGFEAQVSIPDLAKALNRGIGGVQRKLIKLGKLAADQYKTYPSE